MCLWHQDLWWFLSDDWKLSDWFLNIWGCDKLRASELTSALPSSHREKNASTGPQPGFRWWCWVCWVCWLRLTSETVTKTKMGQTQTWDLWTCDFTTYYITQSRETNKPLFINKSGPRYFVAGNSWVELELLTLEFLIVHALLSTVMKIDQSSQPDSVFGCTFSVW